MAGLDRLEHKAPHHCDVGCKAGNHSRASDGRMDAREHGQRSWPCAKHRPKAAALADGRKSTLWCQFKTPVNVPVYLTGYVSLPITRPTRQRPVANRHELDVVMTTGSTHPCNDLPVHKDPPCEGTL